MRRNRVNTPHTHLDQLYCASGGGFEYSYFTVGDICACICTTGSYMFSDLGRFCVQLMLPGLICLQLYKRPFGFHKSSNCVSHFFPFRSLPHWRRNLAEKPINPNCIVFVIQLISFRFSPLVLSSWGLDLRGVPGKKRARKLLFNQGIIVCLCISFFLLGLRVVQ